jgi:hypothetical protein
MAMRNAGPSNDPVERLRRRATAATIRAFCSAVQRRRRPAPVNTLAEATVKTRMFYARKKLADLVKAA